MILQDADIYRVFIGRVATLNNVTIENRKAAKFTDFRKGTETTRRKIVRIIK